MRRTTLLIITVLILGACGGQPTPETAADLPTVAVLPTDTPPPTATPTPTASATMTATATLRPSGTPSPTVSVTPSPTLTDTMTPTPSDTPTITPTVREKSALELLGELAAQATILPPDFTVDGTPINPPNSSVFVVPSQGSGQPTPPPGSGFDGTAPDCPYDLPGGLASVAQNNPDLLTAIGCPIGAPPVASTIASAYQPYQNGFMVWVDSPTGNGTIYAFSNGGTYLEYPDTWNPAIDPERGDETPPDGLIEPVRGFGKVWRENPIVRDTLGWALAGEQGGQAALVQHTDGILIALPQRGEVLALVSGDGWRSYPGGY